MAYSSKKMKMVLTVLNGFAEIKIASEMNRQNRQGLLTFVTVYSNVKSTCSIAINTKSGKLFKIAANNGPCFKRYWLRHIISFLGETPIIKLQ